MKLQEKNTGVFSTLSLKGAFTKRILFTVDKENGHTTTSVPMGLKSSRVSEIQFLHFIPLVNPSGVLQNLIS